MEFSYPGNHCCNDGDGDGGSGGDNDSDNDSNVDDNNDDGVSCDMLSHFQVKLKTSTLFLRISQS
jgi:hypothetical protein